MTELYRLSAEFEGLFASFDRLNSIEDELTEEGGKHYHNGVVVDNVAQYKSDLIAAWFDTLEGMEGEIEDKILNLACYVKDLDGQAAAIKAEKDRLAARQKSAEGKAKRLREYILGVMQTLNRKKVESAQASVTLSAGRESVKISDEREFIKWAQAFADELLSYKEPDISKTAIKLAIKSGREIPFASLEKTPSVSIK